MYDFEGKRLAQKDLSSLTMVCPQTGENVPRFTLLEPTTDCFRDEVTKLVLKPSTDGSAPRVQSLARRFPSKSQFDVNTGASGSGLGSREAN